MRTSKIIGLILLGGFVVNASQILASDDKPQNEPTKEIEREVAAKSNWIPVVVAVEDIAARTKITRAMVTVTKYPKELIVNGAIQDIKKVQGFNASHLIRAKEQIRALDLRDDLAWDVPEGWRAVEIHVPGITNESGIKPGDRVDILAAYVHPKTQQQTTQTILQNIIVLAVKTCDTDSNTFVTVAVKPEDEELVTVADRAGALHVVKRPQ
jgi:Flp pilus assembly protein CpaB